MRTDARRTRSPWSSGTSGPNGIGQLTQLMHAGRFVDEGRTAPCSSSNSRALRDAGAGTSVALAASSALSCLPAGIRASDVSWRADSPPSTDGPVVDA